MRKIRQLKANRQAKEFISDMEFEWMIDAFMVYCRSRQLREKTMIRYEQSLRLFERWCR